MRQTERANDQIEGILAAMDGLQAQIWTAMPGVIQSFNPEELTCVVQIAIQGQITNPDGSVNNVNITPLLDCPVVAPRGGGCSLTFPIAEGDECLMIFASRCIDAWWTSGGYQNPQAEIRLHDLSDGFCIPGPYSQATAISGWSTTAVQLRSNDGDAYVQLNPTSHEIDVVTTGNIGAQASGNISINAAGNVNVTSAIAVNVTAPVINLGASGQTLLKLITSAFQSLFNNHVHASSGAGIPTTQITSAHMTSTVKGG